MFFVSDNGSFDASRWNVSFQWPWPAAWPQVSWWPWRNVVYYGKFRFYFTDICKEFWISISGWKCFRSRFVRSFKRYWMEFHIHEYTNVVLTCVRPNTDYGRRRIHIKLFEMIDEATQNLQLCLYDRLCVLPLVQRPTEFCADRKNRDPSLQLYIWIYRFPF